MSEQATPPNPNSSAPVLCANGCGFFGSAQNGGFCSRCAREKKAAQQEDRKNHDVIQAAQNASVTASPVPTAMAVDAPAPAAAAGGDVAATATAPSAMAVEPAAGAGAAAPSAQQTDVSRCWGCQRKVGLLGFKCRCGFTFCSRHRHSDQHACSYDFKAAAAEQLRKNNPVVQAAKITKI